MPAGFGSMLDLLAPLSVISQPVFIQMSGEVTRSGPQAWKHRGQKSFQPGEIEQKIIWPYSETRERRGWVGQEPTCAWTESIWCFTDMGRNAPPDARHSLDWMSCFSSHFRIKAQLSQKKPCAQAGGTVKQGTSKTYLCYQVLSMMSLLLGLCSWDLWPWELMSSFLTPEENQVRDVAGLPVSVGLGKPLTRHGCFWIF